MQGQMMQFPLTTTAILEYGNRAFAHKQIISKMPDGSWHRYTYADLYQRTRQLAAALHALGVKAGDWVATFAWNHYQHIELYYAIPGVGAVCHTLNIRLSADQLIYIINHADDEIIFLDATLVPLMEKIAPYTTGVKKFVILNAPEGFQCSLPEVLYYEDLLKEVPSAFAWAEPNENDACALCYTSGTTGHPKGVLYSHRSTYLHAMAIMMPNAANIGASDKVLLIVPQFHVMAWGFPYLCVMAGADMVMPSLHLQPAALVNIIQTEKVTKANGVPTIWLGIYDYLKKNPPAEKLTLKEYMVGGSALPKSLIEGFDRDFGIKGVHAWGMTETSPLGTISRLQPVHEDMHYDAQLSVRSKQGIEVPGVDIRAVTSDGSIAPRDGQTMGELQVRGNWVINGYFRSADNALSFSEDGWFKTGDVCTIDAQGYMTITDRTKDLVKSGGEWISSIELETAIMAHPCIREAAVIAIPDDVWVERPLACVVMREGMSVSADELKQLLAEHFAHYQVPDHFVVMAEIPKTSVGKFDKKEMRRMYAAGELSLEQR